MAGDSDCISQPFMAQGPDGYVTGYSNHSSGDKNVKEPPGAVSANGGESTAKQPAKMTEKGTKGLK